MTTTRICSIQRSHGILRPLSSSHRTFGFSHRNMSDAHRESSSYSYPPRPVTSSPPHRQRPEEDVSDITRGFRAVNLSHESSSPPRLPPHLYRLGKKKAEIQAKMSSRIVSGQSTSARKRDRKVEPSKKSGGIPEPTRDYINAATIPPKPLTEAKHLLVVIDLNGTLLHRPNSKSNPSRYVPRPHTADFLKYCIDTFSVVIWSSARPENVTKMCETILTDDMKKKVVAIWGREKFGLSLDDYALRVQCYKRLTRVWEDPLISSSHPEYKYGARWDHTNTVLIDDTTEKARAEPYNLLLVPEFQGDGGEQDHILPQVHDHLNHLSMHSSVSACLRARPFVPMLAPEWVAGPR